MHRRSPDFLIVGGGIAGLRAAIALAPVGPRPHPDEGGADREQHRLRAGRHRRRASATTTARRCTRRDTHPRRRRPVRRGGRARARRAKGRATSASCIDWGTRFDRDADGRPALGREAAHSVRRVLHAGDATGREIGRVLWERVSALPSVETINHALVTELIVEDGRVRGVRFFDQPARRTRCARAATLLATGGAGQVFRETTNPAVATGDGIALAFHAGARVADLEFVQFHPTALNVPGAPRFLISEALRGEGARLVNERGEAFMTRYHPDGDLAPRDVVAREHRARDRSGPAGRCF